MQTINPIPLPLFIADIILSVTWCLLFLAGCYFQYRRERRRPHFPPCPYRAYKHRQMYQPLSGLDTSDIHGGSGSGAASEDDPLLYPSLHRVAAGERDPFDSARPRGSGGGLLRRDYSSTAAHSPQSPQHRRGSSRNEEEVSENRQIIDPM